MADGVGALGFSQTPEANYDSILKAQSQVNRQAASMARTQMSTIQRANAQALKDAKEQQNRIEDLKSQTIESVMYNVPYHSDILSPLAAQIAAEDSRIPLQRAEMGLSVTFEQANTINAHEQTIKDFSNRLNEEFNALETAGYYRIPIVKESYKQHLIALNNGEVPGVGTKTIVNGAPTLTEYMAGPGGRFQPLGDQLLSSFIMEDKYWTSWFDDYNQKLRSSVTEGGTMGSTNVTEGVSAQTSQFTIYDPELEAIRPKTADEIVNEGLITAWFQDNRNYEGAVLLRSGAMDVIAQNKVMEATGEGSNYIMVGNNKVKISDIDPADNGTPLAYTYLQAQVLSDRISTFGMDNTDLNIKDVERRSMTIVNQAREEEIKDTSYEAAFTKLSQVVYNENDVLSKQVTNVINGKEVVDISDFFPSASMRTSEVGTSRPLKSFHYDPSTQQFIVSYATQKQGAKYKTEYETLSVRAAIANINFFDGYRQQTAEQFLNKKKAFDVTSDAVDLSKFRKGSPKDYTASGVAIARLEADFKNAVEASVSRGSSRALREVISATPGGIPTDIGVIKSVSYDTEKKIFRVTLIDGSKQELDADNMRRIKVTTEGKTSLGQSSVIGEYDGLPLSPEQLQLLNRIG